MSVYSAGSDAFRDTTKWLVAFVPISALGTAAVVLGPRLVRSAESARSLPSWLADNVATLAGVLVVLIGVFVIVYFGASVLSTQPKEFTALLETDETGLSKALAAGAGVPYFLDSEAFKGAVADLAVKWQNPSTPPTEVEINRAVGAVDALREWTLQQELSEAFKRFGILFAIGSALIVAGLVVSIVTLEPPSAAIDKPTVVKVSVNTDGAADLLKRTGCTSPTSSHYIAIAGSWSAPVLEVDGPNCRFGTRWEPRSGEFEIQPTPGSTTP